MSTKHVRRKSLDATRFSRKMLGMPVLFLSCFLPNASSSHAQLDFESAPIHYHSALPSGRVQTFAEELESGGAELAYDEQHGYLPAILQHLDVPVSSQMLVFSKTSFQLRRITPRRPRAVYFNDEVYIGWVQNGDVIEISSADPRLGAVFYTIGQQAAEPPRIVRDRGQCIACHASSRTSGVPGHLVRSVYAGRTGQPFFGSGTFTTDHRSPFPERWGGWYVTGTHGQQRHMGNVIATNRTHPEELDRDAGANVTDLSDRIDTEPYLSPHSDIVALMVLEHQTRMHNLITRANFEARSARHYDKTMNEAMGRPKEHQSESSVRRIDTAARQLVEYMLFGEELALTDPVHGTSAFAAEFSARGPRDSQGRSLRDFDLSKRIMKYPCSYLIYSESFDGLPDKVKDRVFRRLYAVLSGEDQSDTFAHLSARDRQAIREILRETKTGLPGYWANEI